MARKVGWAGPAAINLEEAAEFVSRDSFFYAVLLVREAHRTARSLATLARRGRVVPEIGDPDLRELFVYSHRMIYRISEQGVVIVAFVHGARDLAEWWERERKGSEGDEIGE